MDLNFHGTETQLEQYALARLPDPDLSVLEEHLLICTACQERLNEIEDFAIGMQEALGRNDILGKQRTPGKKDVTRVEPARTATASGGTNWFAWLRAPAFSLAVAALAVVGVVAVFSGGRGRLARVRLAPVAALQLTADRGEMPVVAPARELDLTLSRASREAGPFRAEIVDATGHAIWQGAANSNPAAVQIKVNRKLEPGVYFVRLYSGAAPTPHEYGFRVR